MWNAFLQKGCWAFDFTKVKAHTELSDVEAGTTTLEHHLHNKMADETADCGIEADMVGTKAVTETLESRHKAYCRLMLKVHDMIVAVDKADREKRETLHKVNALQAGRAAATAQTEPRGAAPLSGVPGTNRPRAGASGTGGPP